MSVRSALVESEGHAEPDLADVLAEERDRLFDHAGVDEPEPDDADEQPTVLMIDGASVLAATRTEGGLWAARAELVSADPGKERLLVTVVSRGVPVDKLELASIADLRPYLRGRWSMGAGLALGELRQRRHRPSPPRIPTVPEVAHLTLIESSVADSERIRTDLTAGRRPRARREAGSARAARWEAAVRAQMSARHQGRRDANDAVTAMVNHMTHLAEKAAWFRESPELRQAAIDETIRFTAHDEAVRSLAAQQAWLKSWSDRRSTSSLLDEHPATDPDGPVAAEWAEKMRARIAAHEEAERHWLAAWAAWAEAPTKDADQS